MVTLKVSGVPNDLHRKMKVKAAQEGKTLKHLILEIFRREVK